ncbi:MAG: hypothetical protein PHU23_18180, partial [Dehalococcoidales bacterium]|nr:hypothetical protein [Dehalococcoidales bacterium]
MEDEVAAIEIKKLEFYSSDAFEKAADWGDIKLVSPDGTPDDQLYIGAEIIGDDPEKTDDEINIKIYRSNIEPPATEPQGTTVTLQEKKRDNTGKIAICGVQYPVSSLGIPQGEDGVREYAACDGSVNYNAGDQDGFWFDNRMKYNFSNYVSRGCAHRALSEQENIEDYSETDENAPGHKEFGRPIANNEFVMSGGVEKAVITAKTIDITGNAWKKPGKTDFMDHVLIKNPADIFYFSGHGNHIDGNIGDADNFTAIDIFPDEETLYGDPDNQTIEHSWNSELEWVIFVCCSAGDYNGLSAGKYDNINNKRWRDWRPGLRWAKVLLQDKGVHGILAFHAIAGPGENETKDFVNACGMGKTMIQAWQETWVNPPTVICNPAYLNDKISSLQDSDNNDTPINNWSCMNPGYDAPMYTPSGDEVYDGSGSNIYKATRNYDLDNNPPRFPDILEVYNGSEYAEKVWLTG